MAAYTATPLSSVTTLTAATAAPVPASPQSNRLLLKLYNFDSTYPVWYGGSSVSATTGIEIGPGAESDWIPCSGSIYVISTLGTTVGSLEMA